MKSCRLRIVRVCAIAIAIGHGLRAQSPDELIQKLVVMIEGKLGDSPTLGAGIIFGTGQDRLYIVTANHVVRRGADQAKDIKVQLKWLPGEPQEAALLTTSDPDLDLAVLSVAGLSRIGAASGRVPFDMLGDANSLKPYDPTYTLGYPGARPWDIRKGDVRRAAGRTIQFETPFLYPGNSGGALLNGKYELIGLVSRDEPPDGAAVAMDTVIDSLKTWGYPVSLRRSAGVTAVPTAPDTITGGGGASGGASNQSLPNFAGAWEMIDNSLNGVSVGSIRPGNRMTMTQKGNVVEIPGSHTLVITNSRTIGYQIFQAGQPQHAVSAEDQADEVITLSWRIEGEILIYETTYNYRKQYGGHPPGTDVRILKYKRVSDDSSGALPPPPAGPCHIKDVVFVGRSGAVLDALARVTIDGFGPDFIGQRIWVSLFLFAGNSKDSVLIRLLDTTSQSGVVNIPATLNQSANSAHGMPTPEEVNGKATTASIAVYIGLYKGSRSCRGDFPIRFLQ
jgi:hypothetical protein